MAYYDDIKARPTTYKGVKMRSRLEARFAAWLDQWGWEWRYEPQCFAGDGGQYLPDFWAAIPLFPSGAYVEVKPMVADHTEALRRMHVILESEPNASLVVYSANNDDWQWKARCTPDVLTKGDKVSCRCKRHRELADYVDSAVIEVLAAKTLDHAPDTSVMRCAYCDDRYTHLIGIQPFKGGSDNHRLGTRLLFECETCPALTIVSFTNWKGDTEVNVAWTKGRPDGDWIGPDTVGAS